MLQRLEEPKYDTNELDAEFGGHRVLAVMRSPAQDLGAEATVGVPNIFAVCLPQPLLL